jgi:MazG family protein
VQAACCCGRATRRLGQFAPCMTAEKTNRIMEDKRLEATARLLDVMTTLRRECPWDREQTFDSLRSNTIEETYELADAITDHNMEGIKEELGDLLLHVVFYSKLGEEAGAFDYADVANALCDKLVYRHPHVYGDIHANTPDQVKENWEALKLRKKNRKSGTLGGVPRSLPALVKAFRVGEKAAATGFDWQKREDVWDKVKEETAEVEAEMRSGDKANLEAEFGDLFFALVNAARLYGVDPESALERTNKKFIRRFNYMEEQAAAQGNSLHDLSLGEMEALWQEAKKGE